MCGKLETFNAVHRVFGTKRIAYGFVSELLHPSGHSSFGNFRQARENEGGMVGNLWSIFLYCCKLSVQICNSETDVATLTMIDL